MSVVDEPEVALIPLRHGSNPRGNNQWGGYRLTVDNAHEVRDILEGMLRRGLSREEMLRDLREKHGVTIKLRTLFNWMKRLSLGTARRPLHGDQEIAEAILDIVQDDLVGRWGADRVVQKLKLHNGLTSAKYDFVRKFLRAADKQASAARGLHSKHRLHRTSLWSIGPSEEWSGDGHDKLHRMGLPIWGLRDKASRRVVGLWVVPNSRIQTVPVALFLRAARQQGGIPMKVVLDKGSEGHLLGVLQTQMRAQYAPDLSPDLLPPFVTIRSVHNITIERSWRQLLYYLLSSILFAWDTGVRAGVYHEADPVEYSLARWIWARMVQEQLDLYVEEQNNHRIRLQRTTHLPSGNTPNEFWTHPTEHGMQDCLIPVPISDLDNLIHNHTPMGLFQFVSDDMDLLAGDLFRRVGEPKLTVLTTWDIYCKMLYLYRVGQSTIPN